MKKRGLAVLLLLAMALTLLPAGALAAPADRAAAARGSGNPFRDVPEGSWYFDAAQYALANGFFNGTSADTFSPNGTMTRGMFVTVLGRMAGVNPDDYAGRGDFADVPAEAYFAPYVAWAAQFGITGGVGDGKFDPEGLVTREQMAVFFVRYFETFGVTLDAGETVATVPADLDDVSPWARESVLKLWRMGLLNGDGVRFNPRGNTSRAEAAALCMRTDKAVDTWYKEPGVPSDRVSVDPKGGEESGPETPEPSQGGSGDGGGGSNPGTQNPGENPGDPGENPGDPGEDPGDPGEDPGDPGEDPDDPGEAPGDPGEDPDDPGEDPDDPGEDPGDPGEDPGDPGEDPGDPGENPDDPEEDPDDTFYNVTFVVEVDGQRAEQTKPYQKNTRLGDLPSPIQPTGKIFLGWCDSEGHPINEDALLKSDLTLYARFGDALTVSAGGAPDAASALDQPAGFALLVRKTGGAPALGVDFTFRNTTAPERTPDEGEKEDTVQKETVSVTSQGGGLWAISVEGGGFTPGHVYQIELLSEDVTFAPEMPAVSEYAGQYGEENVPALRKLTFSLEREGAMNLQLSDGIRYIRAAALSQEDADKLLSSTGLFTASADGSGDVTYDTRGDSGSFTYDGGGIEVGDTVAVYRGTKPSERRPDKSGGEKTQNDDVVYIKITRIDDDTYYYQSAEVEDVIFFPDVLPIHEGKIVSRTENGGTGTLVINNADLSFAEFSEMGLGADTTVDVGDFLAFYSDSFDDDFGLVTAVSRGEETTVITYRVVDRQTVLASMDLYDETEVPESELDEVLKAHRSEIEEIVKAQLMNTDFFDEAGVYLASMALRTDEVREIFGDGLTLDDCTITYAARAPMGADIRPMGNIVDIDKDGKKLSFSVSTNLVHFNKTVSGVRLEVAVGYEFEIRKKDSDKKLVVELTALFEQEVVFGYTIDGCAVWDELKLLKIPYIRDYRMNGSLELGTYTGIGISAMAILGKDEEPWGMPWPESKGEKDLTVKIFSLSQSIKDVMEAVEKVFPEEEGTVGGSLADKYADFMEDANDTWIDLISVDIFEFGGSVDPLHLLAFNVDVDFVVSANLNVALGLTFNYENHKRHIFCVYVLGKEAYSESIDLSTNGYQFDFYVMGALGLKAGVRARLVMGVFSTKVDAVGLQVDAGAYMQLWGYFYYHKSNYKQDNGLWKSESSSSGAMLLEVGAYLDVTFIAEALNGKYSYQPSLYSKQWPLWSAGERENVYDFAYDDEPDFEIYDVTTFTLPSTVFDMIYMDLKTGETEEDGEPLKANFDRKTNASGHEEYFIVEVTNPSFHYNPVTNAFTIQPGGQAAQFCDVKITWKGNKLSGSSETLTRTLHLRWYEDATLSIISFYSDGGTYFPMLRQEDGTALTLPVPEKAGYAFLGWYRADTGEKFTDTVMPKGYTALHAKWRPAEVGYWVDHYQKDLSGRYVLAESVKTRGYTEDTTQALPKSYVGFASQPIEQKTIEPNGNTRVSVYYDRISYNLLYDFGDGERTVSLKALYGADIVKPQAPSMLGYVFTGWKLNGDKVDPQQVNGGKMPAYDLTFAGEWTARSDTPYVVRHYRQNLNDDGYTLYLTENATGATGAKTAAAVRMDTGFMAQSFEQKTIQADGTTVVEIYYRRVESTVTWDANGGVILSSPDSYTTGKARYGKNIVPPAEVARPGYEFGGWVWLAGGPTGQPLGSGATMPDGPAAFRAVWNAASSEYVVRHVRETLDGRYMESGELVETQTLTGLTGEKTQAQAKEYPGFTAQDFTQSDIAPEGTVVVIRYERNRHALTWDTQGAGTPTGTYTAGNAIRYGTTIKMPNNPSKHGYIFTGWFYEDAEGQEKRLAEGATMPDYDLAVYAKWEEIPENGYRVLHVRQKLDGTYDTNAGTGLVETESLSGTVGDPTQAAAREYAGFTVQPFEQKTISGDSENLTVVEIRYARNVHTVTWHVNLESAALTGSYTQGNTLYETPITKPGVSAPAGYTFGGWHTDEDLTKPLADGATMPGHDLDLYAKWTRIVYTVSFDLNGAAGSAPASLERAYGEAYGTLDTPARTGYTFKGWSRQRNSTAYVAGAGTVTDSHTLYAQWEPIMYYIDFDPNGGTGTMYTMALVYDEARNLDPLGFTRVGYTFKGWKMEGRQELLENEALMVNLTTVHLTNINLAAQWEPVQVTVAFHPNDGTEDVTYLTQTFGSSYVFPSNFQRTGYTLEGWYTEKNGGTKAATVNNPEGHTLYARWVPNTYTVVFNANGGSGTMSSVTLTYDAAAQTLPACSFTHSSQVFSHWNTQADGKGTSYADKEAVRNLAESGSVTLYAQWKNAYFQVGGMNYATLQQAVDAVTADGAVIKALRSASVEGAVIPNTKSYAFTLDLNGKTLSFNDTAIVHNGSGKLTIQDSAGGSGSLHIDLSASNPAAHTIRLGNTAAATVLEITGGRIGQNAGGGYAILIEGKGSVVISGGTVRSGGIYHNGTGNVTVSGSAEVKGGANPCVYLANTGRLIVDGGKVTGDYGTAIYFAGYGDTGWNSPQIQILNNGVVSNASQDNPTIYMENANVINYPLAILMMNGTVNNTASEGVAIAGVSSKTVINAGPGSVIQARGQAVQQHEGTQMNILGYASWKIRGNTQYDGTGTWENDPTDPTALTRYKRIESYQP